jgi:hypothetical protein
MADIGPLANVTGTIVGLPRFRGGQGQGNGAQNQGNGNPELDADGNPIEPDGPAGPLQGMYQGYDDSPVPGLLGSSGGRAIWGAIPDLL